MAKKAPLTDATLIAASKLVDDSMGERWREPSHSDLGFQIDKARLESVDPARAGQTLGKAKRIRAVLSWALEHNPSAGEDLLYRLVTLVQGCGGFRDGSANYAGGDSIESLRSAFAAEGFDLGADGSVCPVVLESLSGSALTDALQAYVRRARRGIEDAALIAGTSKDLLEATAAHVLVERYGTYSTQANFPTLLGQAFVALGFATPQDPIEVGEHPRRRLERAMYDLACAVNGLRNRQGTGHGRPWSADVNDAEAKAAVEMMGCIAERMLASL